MPNGTSQDRAEIDEVVRRFFAAFTNANGATPDVEGLAALFISSAVIVKAVGDDRETYTVQSFIEPRVKLLTGGTLTDFREEETDSRTDIAGNIAQRLSLYRKSGIRAGERFEGRGIKVLQFVRTAAGWRLSAVAWDDEHEGFTIPSSL